MRLPLYALSIFLITSSLFAQELPPIHHFSSESYAGGNQNWAISQSPDKIIYVANSQGLLSYNGEKWTLNKTPNETIIRSVYATNDLIYTGAYMDFGYWERKPSGILNYTSISEKTGISHLEDEEFWGIHLIDTWVIFQSLKRIYLYDTETGKINIIESDQTIVRSFKIANSLFFQQANNGLFKIENGDVIKVSDASIFKTDEVANIFSEQERLLILFKRKGLYSLSSEGLQPDTRFTRTPNDQVLSIYSAIRLKNGGYALGSISQGLLLLDENFKKTSVINQINGLGNNTVLSLFEDVNENIWCGLDNGLSYINQKSPFAVFKDQKGRLGSVYASAIYKGQLYLGTNQGLFRRPLTEKGDFSFVEGTKGQVWFLKVIDQLLFCGHHEGTFIINGLAPQKIANIKGTWKVDKMDGDKDLYIQGNYDGLYILEKIGQNWKIKNQVDGFENSVRHFVVEGRNIFINHEYKGVYVLKTDETRSKVVSAEVDSLLKGANSSISKYKDDVLFAYRNGILKYDSLHTSFVPHSSLNNLYTPDEYTSGRIIWNEIDDELWLFTRSQLLQVTSGGLSTQPNVVRIPLKAHIRNDVVEYESLIKLTSNKYLIGSATGYLVFSLSDLEPVSNTINIGRVEASTSRESAATQAQLMNLRRRGSLESNHRNISINFFTPQYQKLFEAEYRYKLKGIYDSWSPWSGESQVFFENLPYGSYEFQVQSRVANRPSDNTASYSFRIATPWYLSTYMIGGYALLVILFSLFMHNLYRKNYSSKERKLIKQNQRELELAKLQNEKKIIKIQNDQLERDYKRKSNELAASIMSIVKKNELLNQIKEELEKKDNNQSIASVIKIINKNLDQEKNWELFKEAFDNADHDFFNKLKQLHPQLSPNDMKLCAYLRLNLSSKEIAPLINISPRSVEIKRYRLRKKLHLHSNENLTDYIMGL